MGFRSWITGKEYILVDRSNGDEEVGSFPKSITIGQVKELMRNGTIDQGSYRLLERTKAGDKVLWTMSKRKQLSPEEVSKLDKEKAFKLMREKTETVKREVESLKEFRSEMVKEFGDDTGLLQTPIELPDERMGIFDAINRATSESVYIGMRQNPSKVTDMVFNMGDAATNILTAIGQFAALKVSGKTEKQARETVRNVDKQIKEKDGTKVLKFKRKKEEAAEEDSIEQDLESEVVPEKDDIPYVAEEKLVEEEKVDEQ
jgi:hypothetical protein